MEKTDFNKLINKAKASNSNTTIQKVIPVKNKVNEVQFSFYIEKMLLKKLKLQALKNDCSSKQIITNALTQYLK
jgi:hypothetical protein